ncbi:MAG: hypothetical protein ACRD82_13695 [Blastocatellia bacterium]
MRSLFYQGNFCSECGNQLKPRFGFRPRHFCDECAARLRQRSYVTPLAIFLLFGSLVVFAVSYKKQDVQIQKLSPTTPAISAQDSIVNHPSPLQSQSQNRVLCGARTRKGTPCRHLVLPGERCAQHRGQPSLLADKPQENVP